RRERRARGHRRVRDPSGRAARVGLGDRAPPTRGRCRCPGGPRRDEPPPRVRLRSVIRPIVGAMAPQAVTVSFRLGGDDGVSVEARKWAWALHQLGFETRRVAGEIEGAVERDDTVIPSLAIDPTAAGAAGAGTVETAIVRRGLHGADLG